MTFRTPLSQLTGEQTVQQMDFQHLAPAQAGVSAALRHAYANVTSEDVPERFRELLDSLQ